MSVMLVSLLMLVAVCGVVSAADFTDVSFVSPTAGSYIGGEEFNVAWINPSHPLLYLYVSNSCAGPWGNSLAQFGDTETSYTLNTTNLIDGSTYCLRLADSGENEINSGPFTIDNTAPVVTLTAVQQGIENDTSVASSDTRTRVGIVPFDNVGVVYCSIDWGDGAVNNCGLGTSTRSHQYKDGGAFSYNVTVTVRDAAGNEAIETIEVFPLNKAPWNVVINGLSDAIVNQAVVFQTTAEDVQVDEDAGLVYTWTFDKGTASEYTIVSPNADGSIVYAWADDGLHTVDLAVLDKDGGLTTATTFSITIVVPIMHPAQEVIAFNNLNAVFETGNRLFSHGITNGNCVAITDIQGPGFLVDNNTAMTKCRVRWQDSTGGRPSNDERGTHTVVVKVSNTAGDYEYHAFDLTVYSWIIDLQEGWNLISIPFVPEDTDTVVAGNLGSAVIDTSIENVLLEQIGDNLVQYPFYSVRSYQYDGAKSDWVKSRATGYGSLDNIEPGYAYWVKIAPGNATSLKGFGRKTAELGPLPSAEVEIGKWILVGRYGIVTDSTKKSGGISKASALKSLSTVASEIKVYDFENQVYTTTLLPQKGYWAFVNSFGYSEREYTPLDLAYQYN